MSNLLVEVIDDLAVITLNRPESYNAISIDFAKEIKEALLELKKDERIKVLILTGTGKGFCSGADLKILEENKIDEYELGRQFMREVQGLGSIIYHYPVPVIAAVNGVCVGGGFSLALVCDYIISAKSATYSMIFPKVGLVPDIGALYTLPRIIGLPKARRLMYTGKMLTADEAYQYGIVEEVVDDNKLLDFCMEEAKQIASLATRSHRYTKETLNETFEMTFESVMIKESYQQAALFQTNDFNEAITSFVEKRPPKFKGN